MSSLIIAFFSSFIATMLIIRFKHLHIHLSNDWDLSGPQKFHMAPVPRIGGLCVAIGILASVLFKSYKDPSYSIATTFLLCAIPVFFIGLLEDLLKSISIRLRLFITSIGALLAVAFLNLQISSVGIYHIDLFLSYPIIGIGFTIFAITGLTNSYNIIDGFNGLASMVGIITLMTIGYLSFTFSDYSLLYLSTGMACAIFGFFLWNYPRGLIFLGDGGAYLVGFWIACLSVLLINRHPEISPWFALLINAYPIIETIFTIYRRKILRRSNPGMPDGMHLHTLIYRRILNNHHNGSGWLSSNARTAPYSWILTLTVIVPAILWWDSTIIMATFFLLFLLFYLYIYKSIATFKTPKCIHLIS